MNSKSWVDKMMNKYDGALNYKDKKITDMDARDWCAQMPCTMHHGACTVQCTMHLAII